jgi:uncharacterized protein
MPVNSVRPAPAPDELSRPFWESLAQGRLSIQRCGICAFYVHPPFPECTRCRARRLVFEPVSGRGHVYERAIVAAPITPGFENHLPYAGVVVELIEQSRLLVAGLFSGDEPHQAVVGRAVEVVFDDAAEGFVLPSFRLVDLYAQP